MLRVLSKRLIRSVTERAPWVAASRWDATASGGAVEAEPPTPPTHLPAEHFEWDYLVKHAASEEEKAEILQLKSAYSEMELLNRKEFKLTVDWDEFEGQLPEKILDKYKEIYAQAFKDYNDGKFAMEFDEENWNQKKEAMLQCVNDIVQNASEQVTQIEAEIQKIEGKMARLKTATVEEEMALDPELAKRVDDAVSKELGYTP